MSPPRSKANVLTAKPAARTLANTHVIALMRDRLALFFGPDRLLWMLRVALPVASVGVVAAVVRLWDLGRVGFNSDEAVYAGTAASIAGNPHLNSMFPVFRAHPVLLQTIISLAFHGTVTDWVARAICAIIGVLTVAVTYALGRQLYGHVAGVIGALVLAVMPYHVTVSRQVLLDGLMTLLAIVVLYCVVRYAETIALRWLLAAGAMMGLTILAKETSVVLLGGLYVFFALTPVVRLRARHLSLAALALCGVAAVMPIVLAAAGRAHTGQNYLLWQLVRRPNHEILFYFRVVPSAMGWLVLLAAAAGLIWLRRENTWRERLLLSWIAVPVVFFTLWPVKGYQYLLPIAPVVAVLAGRTLARCPELTVAIGPALAKVRTAVRRWSAPISRIAAPITERMTPTWRKVPRPSRRTTRMGVVAGLVLAVVISLAVPAWRQVSGSTNGTFLAGAGGLPGGREAGEWIAAHVPEGAQVLAIGPSMANILQFYGQRRVFALSVSPNPAERNPSYVPVSNPDRALRDGEFQYVVWDSYTAQRTPFFASKARELIDRYHGVAVFTATVSVRAASGASIVEPAIIVYQVRAS